MDIEIFVSVTIVFCLFFIFMIRVFLRFLNQSGNTVYDSSSIYENI
jgi:hypothetical protein